MAGKTTPKTPEEPISQATPMAQEPITQPQTPQEAAPDQRSPQEIKIEELTATIKYLQADYENYRKRVERDKADFKLHAARSFIESLLPIVDTFELCLKAASTTEPSASKDLLQGFEMLYAQLVSMLETQGVTPITAQGIYNPTFHEPLLQDTSIEPKGTIIEELQKGYMLGDKVLRATKVKISKGPA